MPEQKVMSKTKKLIQKKGYTVIINAFNVKKSCDV